MSKVLFTLPGKIGDAFHQYPIAYHWHLKHQEKFHLGLDMNMLAPLAPLFAAQEAVEKVWQLPGIESYHMGGQPFDFGFPHEAYKVWDKVYHLGFRAPAEKPITLATRDLVDYPINTKKLKEVRTLFGSRPPQPRNLLLLHGSRHEMYGETPLFWKAIVDTWDLLVDEFDEIFFIGTSADRRIARRWADAEEFDDAGDWLKLVDFMQDARLVMGGGSSMVSLAGALKVPSIRIHDPMPGWRPEVFTNFGPYQWNLEPMPDYRAKIESILTILEKSWTPLEVS